MIAPPSSISFSVASESEAENARAPARRQHPISPSSYEDARTAPIAAAETATGSRAATPTARRSSARMRPRAPNKPICGSNISRPLTQGPIGKLAKNDLTTQQAIEALFPRNPLPNSAGEVLDAVTGLAARNPGRRNNSCARMSKASSTRRRAISRPAPASSAARVSLRRSGQPQQAANLAASIQGQGPQALEGSDRLLRVMEATGQRQRIGSQTAFNIEVNKNCRGGRYRRQSPMHRARVEYPGPVPRNASSLEHGPQLGKRSRISRPDPQGAKHPSPASARSEARKLAS